MANKKYPYDEMEAEYIGSDTISMRAIAAKYGVPNYSLVHQYARGHKWSEKRALRQAKTDQKILERSADRAARRFDRLEEAVDDTIELIIETINKVRRDMRETPEKVQVAPRDLALLIDRLLVMKGLRRPFARVSRRGEDARAIARDIDANVARIHNYGYGA